MTANAEEPTVRVRLFQSVPSVTMDFAGAWTLTGGDSVSGTVELHPQGEQIRLVRAEHADEIVPAPLDFTPTETSSTVTIRKIPYGVGWWWEAKQDRDYSSQLTFRVLEGDVMQGVATMRLEKYLQGVVPSEIGPDSPLEALKTQAVAARSETVRALKSRIYAGPDYDICADVECQAYSGDTKRSAASDRAIAETKSLVLTHKGEVIGAYYASNSGGMTENVENVWPERSGPAPYWSGQYDGDPAEAPKLTDEESVRRWIDSSPEVFSNPKYHPGMPDWAKKNFRWERQFKVDDLSARLSEKHPIGRFLRIEPLKRGVSGRIARARIVGTEGSFEVDRELALRKLFDPPLRSSCFYVETIGPADAPTEIRIVGAGYGHGVGMCQTGAICRAIAGQDFRTILTHYYRETEIVPAY